MKNRKQRLWAGAADSAAVAALTLVMVAWVPFDREQTRLAAIIAAVGYVAFSTLAWRGTLKAYIQAKNIPGNKHDDQS